MDSTKDSTGCGPWFAQPAPRHMTWRLLMVADTMTDTKILLTFRIHRYNIVAWCWLLSHANYIEITQALDQTALVTNKRKHYQKSLHVIS